MHNVCFNIKMDIEKGQENFVKKSKGEKVHGTLKTCFSLEKLMESHHYHEEVACHRLYVRIVNYYLERDYVSG